MLKRYTGLLLLLVLLSCKQDDTQTHTPAGTYRILLALEAKDSADLITKESLTQGCNILKERLSTLQYDDHKIQIINDSHIEIYLSRPLKPSVKKALLSSEPANLHLIESKHLSEEYAACFKSLDSLLHTLFEEADILDEQQEKKVLFRHLWANGYSGQFPESNIDTIEKILNKKEIRDFLGTKQLLWSYSPFRDPNGEVVKDKKMGCNLFTLHHLSQHPSITHDQIRGTSLKARSSRGAVEVNIHLTPAGTNAFNTVTHNHRGKLLALVFKGRVHTIIKIVEEIPENVTTRRVSTYPEIDQTEKDIATITSNLTEEQALELALILTSEELPFRFLLVE